MPMRPITAVLRYTLLLMIWCGILSACRSGVSTDATGEVEHASLLRITRTDSFTRVDIRDPWHTGGLLQSYVLVSRSQPLPHGLPEATLLRTPLRRAVVASSVHAALLYELGCDTAVIGICDTAYVIAPALRADVRNGRLLAMGSAAAIDAERLVAARPDALLASPMAGAAWGAAAAAGVPAIACADYMETSALGRAEWMKFYGLLFGCGQRADSLFAATAEAYDSLRTAAIATKTRPRLLTDMKMGAVWYVPGGKSYLGSLYADAGASYVFADRSESGSVSLDAEAVLAQGADAVVWLVKYGAATDLTYQAMAEESAVYTRFAPWRQRRVYGCNTLRVPYYEEVPFHPDRLLRDVVSILHPTLLPAYRPHYFTPLQ